MRQPLMGARMRVGSVVAAELLGAVVVVALTLAGVGLAVAIAVGAVVASLWCVVTLAGLTGGQWVRRGVWWLRHREHRLVVADRRAPAEPDQERDDATS